MDNLPKVDSKPVTPLETSSDAPAAHAGHPDVPADVREVPIETFNTPLEVAPVSPLPTEEAEEVVYEGQILAPENYSKVSTSATEAAPRRGNKFLKWLGLGAAGAGIATAAVFGAKAVSDNGTSNEPPVNDPKATNQPEATATPEITTVENNQVTKHDPLITPENRETIIESLRIKASMSDEEKIKKIIELSSRTTMAGATPEFFEQYQEARLNESGVTPEKFAKEAALDMIDPLATAAYGEDWPNNPKMQPYAAQDIETHALALQRFLATYGDTDHPNTNSKNKEAYEESLVNPILLGSASSKGSSNEDAARFYAQASAFYGADAEVLVFTAVRENNAESNMFGDNETYAAVDNKMQYFNTVLVPDGKGNLLIRFNSIDDAPNLNPNYQ